MSILRDCSVQAEGRREERGSIERRKDTEKGEGRQFNAVQGDCMSSSHGISTSSPATSCSIFVVLEAVWL